MRYEIIATSNEDELVLIDRETCQARLLPRYFPWKDLAALPVDLLTSLSEWANKIEYNESSYLHDADMSRFLTNAAHTDPDETSTWQGYIAKSLGIKKGDRILDFGTGVGQGRLALLKDGYIDTVGVDASPDCLRRQADWAVKLNLSTPEDEANNLVTTEKFMGNLSEYSETFSLIYLTSTLHHIADTNGFFSVCATLLKRGGKLFCENEPTNKAKFHNLTDASQTIDLLELRDLTAHKLMRKTKSTTRMAEVWDGCGFSQSDLAKQLETAGFDLIRWEPDAWISYIFHHIVRGALKSPEDKESISQFEAVLRKTLEIDQLTRSMVNSDFAEANFFTVRFAAERR
jgi:ubiquinone/menaquinone biosynthesis C-methylase UbiE